MSATFSIGCRDCKKCLWIGQSERHSEAHPAGWYLYTGHPNIMQALEVFLKEHGDHSLCFFNDEYAGHNLGCNDFEEIWIEKGEEAIEVKALVEACSKFEFCDSEGICPECGNYEYEGHDNCRFGDALAAVKKLYGL